MSRFICFHWGGAETYYPSHQLLKLLQINSTGMWVIRFQGDLTSYEIPDQVGADLLHWLQTTSSTKRIFTITK